MKTFYNKVQKIGIYRLIGCLFLLGLIIGILFANFFRALYVEGLFLFDDQYKSSIESITLNQSVIFQLATIRYFKDFFLIYLFSITVIGIPYLVLHNVYKGFCLGFLISTATMRFGMKGMIFILSYLFPHYLILLPLYVLTYHKCYELNYLLTMKGVAKEQRPLIAQVPFFIFLIAMIILASFLEGFLNAGLIKYVMIKFL